MAATRTMKTYQIRSTTCSADDRKRLPHACAQNACPLKMIWIGKNYYATTPVQQRRSAGTPWRYSVCQPLLFWKLRPANLIPIRRRESQQVWKRPKKLNMSMVVYFSSRLKYMTVVCYPALLHLLQIWWPITGGISSSPSSFWPKNGWARRGSYVADKVERWRDLTKKRWGWYDISGDEESWITEHIMTRNKMCSVACGQDRTGRRRKRRRPLKIYGNNHRWSPANVYIVLPRWDSPPPPKYIRLHFYLK